MKTQTKNTAEGKAKTRTAGKSKTTRKTASVVKKPPRQKRNIVPPKTDQQARAEAEKHKKEERERQETAERRDKQLGDRIVRAKKSGRYLIFVCRVSRGKVFVEWNTEHFPLKDLPTAKEMIAKEIDKIK